MTSSKSRLYNALFKFGLSVLLLACQINGWAIQKEETQNRQAEIWHSAKAGQLYFQTESLSNHRPAIMLDSDVAFDISGMIAHVRMTQTFQNDSRHWAEGIYVFPLPDTAAVNQMRIIVGDRIIEGKVREKSQAQRLYQKAKASGRKASIVSQERPNMFTQAVANIAPGETVTVELGYIQRVSYRNGLFSLRFPMTITPRYIPGSPVVRQEQPLAVTGTGWAANTDQVSDAERITPPQDPGNFTTRRDTHQIHIEANVSMGMTLSAINSAYHNIVVAKDADRYHVTTQDAQVPMNQDFVLQWRPVTGSEPQAALFSETVADRAYHMLMVLPPQQSQSESELLSREMIFVVDTSGSMGGVSIRQARAALNRALTQLRPTDNFNIIAFNNRASALFDRSVNATQGNIHGAQNYVANLTAGGGTEMGSALKLALGSQSLADKGRQRVRQVVFITDGAVGNEQALFQYIEAHLKDSRLFTVGIGSAPNSFFMRKSAQFGRGTYTHIGQVSEVSEKMAGLFQQLQSPVARNIQIDWPQLNESETIERYPQHIPDLYLGEPLIVAFKAPAPDGPVSVRGLTASTPWRQQIRVDQERDSRGVSTLWAREKIADLLDGLVRGEDETQVREAVLQVALQHQLVSPYTSFIAIEQNPSRPKTESLDTKNIANRRPKGQTPQSYAFPQTATEASWYGASGFILLLLAIALWLIGHFRLQTVR